MSHRPFLFVGERLVVDLLNTVIVQDGQVRDLLGTRADLAAWAEGAGVVRRGGPAGASGRWAREPGGLRAFRERLRSGLVAWAATGNASRRLIGLLNTQLARDPETVAIGVAGGSVVARRRRAAPPLDLLYGAVARSAAEMLATGAPRRLRKCANPSCRLMFYDVSKAGRRRWCSMQTCGGRAKVRAFYRRQRKLRRLSG